MDMAASERCLPNPGKPLRTVDAHAELLCSLTRITTESPPVHTCSTGWKFSGFYAGPTSVAYLFWRLSHLYGPDFEFRQQTLLEWAEAYLSLGQKTTHPSNAVTPDHCGVANEKLAHLALSAAMHKDELPAKQLCAQSKTINSTDDDLDCGSNEWLDGRAGYLYFLRLCQAELESTGHHAHAVSLLQATTQTTVARILAAPQPWTRHGKAQLGAAHGAIGTITQVTLSDPSAAPKLQGLLASLLDAPLPRGNVPSARPQSAGAGADGLVPFCHGAPGLAVSLRALLPHFPALASRMERAAERAGQDVWPRGLLTQESCLCRGIAGNAMAMEGERSERSVRSASFVSCMGSEAMAERGHHAGLFTGEAGRTWVWAVADTKLETRCIAYSDC